MPLSFLHDSWSYLRTGKSNSLVQTIRTRGTQESDTALITEMFLTVNSEYFSEFSWIMDNNYLRIASMHHTLSQYSNLLLSTFYGGMYGTWMAPTTEDPQTPIYTWTGIKGEAEFSICT